MAAVDYHNTGTTSSDAVYAANWRAQTFTATGDYSVASVKIHAKSGGVASGNVTVSIRATDGDGKPTGNDLASCTLPVTALPVMPAAADWVAFTFDSSAALTSGTLYAIVCRAPSCTGAAGNAIYWSYTYATNYAGGKYVSSTDSGATWGTPNATVDFWFETYEPTATYEDMSVSSGGVGGGSASLGTIVSVDMAVTDGGTGGGSAFLVPGSFVSEADYEPSSKLVVAGNDQIWIED